jgi:hypothetical protein
MPKREPENSNCTTTHIYQFHCWKGQFSLRQMRSATTYADIADRFEVAIGWIKEARIQDHPPHCPDCGETDRVARALSFSVITGDDEIFKEQYDDLSWSQTIQRLQSQQDRLRKLQEPQKRCITCGLRNLMQGFGMMCGHAHPRQGAGPSVSKRVDSAGCYVWLIAVIDKSVASTPIGSFIRMAREGKG